MTWKQCGKRKNASYQHFFLFPQCFLKVFFVYDRVENIVGKGENAGYQHFLPFPQCFLKVSSSGWFKLELCGKELALYQMAKFETRPIWKQFGNNILNVIKIMICATDWVENIVGKGENTGYQHFLLFPQCFLKVSFSGSLKVRIVY